MHQENRTTSLLLVEDHDDTLSVLGRLLKSAGYLITSCRSYASALEEARRNQYDVLVTDYALGDGVGTHLLAEIRAMYPIKSIAISAYAKDEDRQMMLSAGFDRFLAKPLGVTQLTEAVKELLHAPVLSQSPSGTGERI